MDAVTQAVWNGALGDRAVDYGSIAGDDLPVVERHADANLAQVVQHDQIRPKSGRDRTPAVEPPVVGRVPGGQPDRSHRIESQSDGLAQGDVHVTVVEEGVDVAVVGAEAAARVGRIGDKGKERGHVPRRGSLPDHHHLPGAQLFPRFVKRRRFVIRAGTRSDVRL